jgi:hypothetical protein
MKTYQTLSLIGNILGILLTIGLFVTESFLLGFSGNIAEDETFGSPELQQRQTEFERDIGPFLAGLSLAFVAYIVLLILTFVLKPKHSKGLGIVLLVVGFLGVIATNGWGIIPYALLIPASVLAIREAKRRDKEEEEKRVTTEERRTETGGEKKSYSFTEGWGDDKK